MPLVSGVVPEIPSVESPIRVFCFANTQIPFGIRRPADESPSVSRRRRERPCDPCFSSISRQETRAAPRIADQAGNLELQLLALQNRESTDREGDRRDG